MRCAQGVPVPGWRQKCPESPSLAEPLCASPASPQASHNAFGGDKAARKAAYMEMVGVAASGQRARARAHVPDPQLACHAAQVNNYYSLATDFYVSGAVPGQRASLPAAALCTTIRVGRAGARARSAQAQPLLSAAHTPALRTACNAGVRLGHVLPLRVSADAPRWGAALHAPLPAPVPSSHHTKLNARGTPLNPPPNAACAQPPLQGREPRVQPQEARALPGPEVGAEARGPGAPGHGFACKMLPRCTRQPGQSWGGLGHGRLRAAHAMG